jgi:hypothetical protein
MRIAATLYGVTGAVLIAALLALPDPTAWRPAYTDAIREAYRQAPAVAAATFPGWRPEREPLLVTRGRVNYLVQPDFTVERLKQPVIPVVANGVVTYAGRDVAVVATGKTWSRSSAAWPGRWNWPAAATPVWSRAC